MSMFARDRDLIIRLSEILSQPDIDKLVQHKMAEAVHMMKQRQDGEPWGMAEVPITVFQQHLPATLKSQIGLCRAFVLKAGRSISYPERHINSIQRLMAYKNAGTMHVATDVERYDFQPHAITGAISGPDRNILNHSHHWNIVEPNIWHYPAAAPGADWQTLTFHSVSAADMREEDAVNYKIQS